MSRRKLEHRNIRKLNKSGGGRSISLTLPIEFVRKLRWRGGQKVVVDIKNKSIIIKDWPVSPRTSPKVKRRTSRGGRVK